MDIASTSKNPLYDITGLIAQARANAEAKAKAYAEAKAKVEAGESSK